MGCGTEESNLALQWLMRPPPTNQPAARYWILAPLFPKSRLDAYQPADNFFYQRHFALKNYQKSITNFLCLRVGNPMIPSWIKPSTIHNVGTTRAMIKLLRNCHCLWQGGIIWKLHGISVVPQHLWLTPAVLSSARLSILRDISLLPVFEVMLPLPLMIIGGTGGIRTYSPWGNGFTKAHLLMRSVSVRRDSPTSPLFQV